MADLGCQGELLNGVSHKGLAKDNFDCCGVNAKSTKGHQGTNIDSEAYISQIFCRILSENWYQDPIFICYLIQFFFQRGRQLPKQGDRADCNLQPTWGHNNCAHRDFFCAGVGMKCYRVEVFWGQLGIFQGQCTVQVALRTALYDKLNDKNPSHQTWESLVLIFMVENNTQE